MKSCLFATMVAVALTRVTWADGLVYQLPEDGALVRYETELAINANGQEINAKGTVSLSSVGQVDVDNEKCRWIELKLLLNHDGQEHPALIKALIPEKHLGKGKGGAENLIRAWVKEGEGEPMEIRDVKTHQAIALRAFLAGPLKNPGDLDKAEVDGKLGKLECAGVTGDQEIDFENNTITMNYENRLHEKSPFGLVTGAWKFELRNNGQTALTGTFKLTLVDTSTTALSELPDRK